MGAVASPPSTAGGCFPDNTNYGVAVAGIRDDNGTTLPARLAINSNKEPNLIQGKAPTMFMGTLTISSLTIGKPYKVLRYNAYKNVPTAGDAAAFRSSNYTSSFDFVAKKTIFVYKDKAKIPSDGVAYYRVVSAA